MAMKTQAADSKQVNQNKGGDVKSILQGRINNFFDKKTPTPLSQADVASLGLTDSSLPRYQFDPPAGNMGGASYTAVIKDGAVYVNRVNTDAKDANEWFKLPGKAPQVPGGGVARPTPTAVTGTPPSVGGGVAKPTPTAVGGEGGGGWLNSNVARPTPTAVPGRHHRDPVAKPTPTAVDGGRGGSGPVAKPTPTAVDGGRGGEGGVARPTPTAVDGGDDE